jgi:radical SAM protein with 4Fe4S-binding SPASM domain
MRIIWRKADIEVFMARFKKIYIEITNVCNLSCGFCPKTSRAPVFMTPAGFGSVLERIRDWTGHVCLHVMGEPLLHPALGGLLDLCASHGLKANLTTNGTLLEKACGSILDKPALRQVNISLHSFEANAGGYPLDGYLGGVLRFTGAALEGGRVIVSLRLWNVSGGGKNSKNAYIVHRIGEAFKPGLTLEDIPPGGRGVKLAERLYINTASVFRWPGAGKADPEGGGFCRGLRDHAAILADGAVVPCCLDSEGAIRLGNIFEQDFGEILGGERASALYRGFSERKALERLCRSCGYRTRFSQTGGVV